MALVQFALERSRYTQISSGKTHAGQLKEAAQEGSMTRLEASARRPHLSRMVVAGLWAFLLAIPCADARITRIEIDAANSQNPTFGGRSFQGPGGTVGTYEKITARAYPVARSRSADSNVHRLGIACASSWCRRGPRRPRPDDPVPRNQGGPSGDQ